MITVTRRFDFCAGHRLMGHEGKCLNMHGHNYVAEVTVAGRLELDSVGRLVDFSELKHLVGDWINAHWDHAFIYHRDDIEVRRALQCVAGQKTYTMDENPTAEVMARYLLDLVVRPGTFDNLAITEVRLWETPNCCATATREP